MDENKNKELTEGIVEQIKELVKKGNIVRVLIKKDENTIVNLPMN